MVFIVLGITGIGNGAETQYEEPPVFQAAAILPADHLKSPTHTVEENVRNDGYMNTYIIDSRFGQLKAVSTELMRIRIQEFKAIEVMNTIEGTDEFQNSFIDGGEDVINGARGLIMDPVGTIGGAISGVGKAFNRASEGLFGSQQSQYEDDRVKSIIGFAKTKRGYAKQFGVDVYSSNPILQKYLDNISWAGYAGGLTLSASTMVIPGAAGLAVSLTGGSNLLNEVVADSAPTDLRKMNREKLLSMGIDEVVANLYIDNSIFSPRQQTLLVDALDRMPTTQNRGAFMQYAIQTSDEDSAFFRQLMAQMYVGYYQHKEQIKRFDSIANIPVGVTKSGKMVVAAPIDYLAWTQPAQRIFDGFGQYAKSNTTLSGKELWLFGKVSPLSRKNLEQQGWRVFELSQKELIK